VNWDDIADGDAFIGDRCRECGFLGGLFIFREGYWSLCAVCVQARARSRAGLVGEVPPHDVQDLLAAARRMEEDIGARCDRGAIVLVQESEADRRTEELRRPYLPTGVGGLQVCVKCGALRGTGRREDHDTTVEQECRCLAGSAGHSSPLDFNKVAELCRCCGMALLTCGTPWSTWFCWDCRDQVDWRAPKCGTTSYVRP